MRENKKSNKNNNNNNNKKKKKKEEETRSYEYSYCKVCRINHDQGRRHNYFPSHVSSLSSFLFRFLSKLQYIRTFLTDPTTSQHVSSSHRFWCIFCELDVVEVGSPHACGNAINHLASADHLKKLKSFLWEFGGKMDQVESFSVSEGDLNKWEKKCKTLNMGAASEDSGRPLTGPPNDIQNNLNSVCQNSNQKNTTHFVSSNFPNCVMPLQFHTNEKYQVCHSELVGSACNASTSCLSGNAIGLKNSSGHVDNKQPLVGNDNKRAGNSIFSNGGLYQAHNDTRLVDRGNCLEESEGNVHTGAPPPWFDSSEKSLLEIGHKIESESESSNIASFHQKSWKIQKLNPKRVGAAWAEKRKIELELQKRGEVVFKNFDGNWLPNFGSVWQSGTRKESRKEFNAEKKLPLKTVPQSGTLIEIQPYVSKRKREDMSTEG